MHGTVQRGSESLPTKEELAMQEQVSSSMATGLTSNLPTSQVDVPRESSLKRIHARGHF